MGKFTLEDLIKDVKMESQKLAEEKKEESKKEEPKKEMKEEKKEEMKEEKKEEKKEASVDAPKEPSREPLNKMPEEAAVGEEEDKESEETEKAEKEPSTGEVQEPHSPVDDAIKMAEKLASMEKEALVKEAELIGKSIIDGAMARINEYEKLANEQQVKIASEQSFEKVAEAIGNDDEALASFQQGYMDKIAEEIEKDPEAKKAFVEGYEKTASEIIKVATFVQDKGYVELANTFSKLSK